MITCPYSTEWGTYHVRNTHPTHTKTHSYHTPSPLCANGDGSEWGTLQTDAVRQHLHLRYLGNMSFTITWSRSRLYHRLFYIVDPTWRIQSPRNSLTFCNMPASGLTIRSWTTWSTLASLQRPPLSSSSRTQQISWHGATSSRQKSSTQDWTHRRWSPWCSQSLTSSNTQSHQQEHSQLRSRIKPSSTRTNSCTSGHESQRHRRQDTQDLATRSVQRTHWTIQQSHHTRHKKSFPRETTPRCREDHRQDVAWTQQEQMLHSSDTWRTPTTQTLHSYRQHQQPHQRQEARDHPHYRLRIQDPGREEQGGLGPTHTSDGDGRVGSHQMGMDPRSHRWRDGHQQLHPTVRTTHSPTHRQDPTSQRSLEHLFLATRHADEIRRHV